MMLKCPECGLRGQESRWPYWLHLQDRRCPRCWEFGLSVPPVKEEPARVEPAMPLFASHQEEIDHDPELA